ncbi:MAG: hypothetical protein WC696_02005 [Candidatus Methylopumilus sp.]|jgi:hypothetical protein
MTTPVIVRGWRNALIDQGYDDAVNAEGTLYKEGVTLSMQKGYIKDYRRDYHKTHKAEANAKCLAGAYTDLGYVNQRMVAHVIVKINLGEPLHYRTTRISAELFEQVRDLLISKGKVNAKASSITGEHYLQLLDKAQEALKADNAKKSKAFQSFRKQVSMFKRHGLDPLVQRLTHDHYMNMKNQESAAA